MELVLFCVQGVPGQPKEGIGERRQSTPTPRVGTSCFFVLPNGRTARKATWHGVVSEANIASCISADQRRPRRTIVIDACQRLARTWWEGHDCYLAWWMSELKVVGLSVVGDVGQDEMRRCK
jgi:hypothetical protein